MFQFGNTDHIDGYTKSKSTHQDENILYWRPIHLWPHTATYDHRKLHISSVWHYVGPFIYYKTLGYGTIGSTNCDWHLWDLYNYSSIEHNTLWIQGRGLKNICTFSQSQNSLLSYSITCHKQPKMWNIIYDPPLGVGIYGLEKTTCVQLFWRR